MTTTSVKTIIFDLGNVIMFFDRNRAYNAIARALNRKVGDIRNIIEQSDIRNRYESGLIDTEKFMEDLTQILNSEKSLLSDSKLKDFWAEIFQANSEMHQALGKIDKMGISLVLLSNTNPLHYEYIERSYPEIFKLFDHIVLSYQEKCLKPDENIFRAAVNRITNADKAIKIDNILFIDDKPENTGQAQAMGIKSFTYKSFPLFTIWLRKQGIYLD